MNALEPDRDQIEIFADALLRHAGGEGYMSLRAFVENPSKPFQPRLWPNRLNGGGLRHIVDVATDIARRAAQNPEPVVFCPPIACFSNPTKAGEADLVAGLALSVEMDRTPHESIARIEEIIGPATAVVRSGGQWIDPATGAAQDKLHGHWRLAQPARGENLEKLKQARLLATRIAGGDPSNVPLVHPIRWPGSWHRKAKPRLCEIVRCEPDREIDLGESLAALTAAAPEEEPKAQVNGHDDGGEDWEPLLAKIISAEEIYPSCVPLTMKLQRAGMSDGAVVNLARAVVNLSAAKNREPDRARNAYDKIPAMVRDGRAKIGGERGTPKATDASPWRFFGQEEDVIERTYLIDKLLPETGVGLISGQWGTYKTFVALDLAAAVITGTPFAGFDVARQGAVLFMALEGEGEINIRLRAALTHRGRTEKLAPFAWVDNCPRLLAPDAGNEIAALVKPAAERMLLEFHLPVALVIVDTVGKAAAYAKSGDENDAVVGKQIVNAMAEASRGTGALFLGIDHFGKSVETGTRGSSAKESDCDVVLALLGDKSMAGEVTSPRLAIRKRRSGANGVEIPFRTTVVPAGADETTLVIDWLQPDQVAPATKPDAWAKSLRLLRQTLMNVLVDHGTDMQPFSDGPTVRGVDVETVRDEFYKTYPAEGDAKSKQQARKKAFQRAVKDAQAKGLVGVRDIGAVTFMWLAKAAEGA